MRTRIAAALGLAAGLMAAPAFAQQEPAPTTRGVHPVTPPAASTTNPSPPQPAPTTTPGPMATPGDMAAPGPMAHHTMGHHRMVVRHPMMMHHPMMHAAAAPRGDSEHMTIEQLNNMSLQAAQKGQNFTPPAGR